MTIPEPFRVRFAHNEETAEAVIKLLRLDTKGWQSNGDHLVHEVTNMTLHASDSHGVYRIGMAGEHLFEIIDYDNQIARSAQEVYRRDIRDREDTLMVAIKMILSEHEPEEQVFASYGSGVKSSASKSASAHSAANAQAILGRIRQASSIRP